MPDDRKSDRIVGKKIRFTWEEGPTKGETHEHTFNADGSVDYQKVGEGAPKGKPTHEKKYGTVRVTDDVYMVSYLGSAGFTLTVVLNFEDHRIAGFASNDKQWFPVKGTFEEVK
jgi:phenolic acid decarboxylase